MSASGIRYRSRRFVYGAEEQNEAYCLSSNQCRRHGRGGSAQAAGDATRGQAEFEVCAVCHGENGEGFEKYGGPNIGGQEEWYVITSLKNFRASLRAKDNCDVADVAGTLERAKAKSPSYADIESELASHFDGTLPAGGDCSQPSADVYGPLMRSISLTLADDHGR